MGLAATGGRTGEAPVARQATTRIPIHDREWTVHVYEHAASGAAHLALVLGQFASEEAVLVRAHSECLTGDVFGSQRCDCGPQLQAALAAIAAEGRGVLVYIREHEGRGIGLVDKLRAYALQDQGLDTVEANEALGLPADNRSYAIAGYVLRDLGVRRARLLTNNPQKRHELDAGGVEVVERLPLVIAPNRYNHRYLEAKRAKLGHLL